MSKWEFFALGIVVILMASVMALCAKPAPRAVEIRLIGECGGKFYGAQEESDFPEGCAWIEPVRVDME